MKYKLQQVLETNWSKINRGGKPRRIQFIIINKVFLVFKDKEKEPFIAVKFSENGSLKHEFNNLQSINKLLPDDTPKPYFYEKEGDYYLLGQSFHIGTNMSTIKITERELNIVFKSLIKFHKAVYKHKIYLNKQYIDEMLSKPISQFLEADPDWAVADKCNELIGTINQFKNCSLPYIPQHCDFCPVNLIFNHKAERLYMIDWADFGKSYLPLYDLFLLIINYYFSSKQFSGLLEADKINNVFNDCIAKYLKHFEIDKRLVPILFPISLITFFNQNYPDRIETSKTAKKLVTFCLENRDKLFLNRLF